MKEKKQAVKVKDLDKREIRELDDKVRDRQFRNDSFIYRRYHDQVIQLRTSRKEIRELKKKVDKLHSTIGFLLTQ